jgi:hypothetical protein
VKAEPTTPKPAAPTRLKPIAPKRKLEVYIGSDGEDDDAMSLGSAPIKATKGGRGKQAKASGSKVPAGGVASSTRKSSRLDSTVSAVAKKPRTASASPEGSGEALVRRLASQFAEIAKTYDEIADHMRL